MTYTPIVAVVPVAVTRHPVTPRSTPPPMIHADPVWIPVVLETSHTVGRPNV
jgi:hypothetical protein